jgi:hypothetical protein
MPGDFKPPGTSSLAGSTTTSGQKKVLTNFKAARRNDPET